jgi:hypothetical protein
LDITVGFCIRVRFSLWSLRCTDRDMPWREHNEYIYIYIYYHRHDHHQQLGWGPGDVEALRMNDSMKHGRRIIMIPPTVGIRTR